MAGVTHWLFSKYFFRAIFLLASTYIQVRPIEMMRGFFKCMFSPPSWCYNLYLLSMYLGVVLPTGGRRGKRWAYGIT